MTRTTLHTSINAPRLPDLPVVRSLSPGDTLNIWVDATDLRIHGNYLLLCRFAARWRAQPGNVAWMVRTVLSVTLLYVLHVAAAGR
jgi:hypothetical protein